MSSTSFKGNAADTKNSQLVFRITCICWLAAKLLSWRLWLTNRTFPLLPPADWIALPGWVHLVLYVSSLLIIILLIVGRARRFVLLLLFVVEVASCLPDVNRLQPWQYQYLTMLLIVLLYFNNRRLVISSFAFIIFSTYFFSGLSKLNSGFITHVWQQTILLRFFHLPLSLTQSQFLYYTGYTAPLFELVAAVFLLIDRTRKTAAIMLILVCVFNLLLLGPFGVSYNVIVWPWNLCMIGVLLALFVRKDAKVISFKALLSGRTLWVLIVWGLLPITNLFGFWDDYLSSALYTGGSKQLLICLRNEPQTDPAQLLRLSKAGSKVCPGNRYIQVNRWAMHEMNVPCYPEMRVFKTLEKELKKQYGVYDFTFNVYQGTNTLPYPAN